MCNLNAKATKIFFFPLFEKQIREQKKVEFFSLNHNLACKQSRSPCHHPHFCFFFLFFQIICIRLQSTKHFILSWVSYTTLVKRTSCRFDLEFARNPSESVRLGHCCPSHIPHPHPKSKDSTAFIIWETKRDT